MPISCITELMAGIRRTWTKRSCASRDSQTSTIWNVPSSVRPDVWMTMPGGISPPIFWLTASYICSSTPSGLVITTTAMATSTVGWSADTNRGARPLARQFAAQLRHAQDRPGSVLALVALAVAGTRQRLLHVLDREHSERARHAGVEADSRDPGGGLVADVVVVRRLTADHRAHARDAVEAPRLGAVLRGQRQLERARHVVHLHGRARLLEDSCSACDEPLGQILVEARHRYREARVSHPAAPARARPRPHGRGPAPRGSSPRRAPVPGGAGGVPCAPSSRAGTPCCAASACARSPPGR